MPLNYQSHYLYHKLQEWANNITADKTNAEELCKPSAILESDSSHALGKYIDRIGISTAIHARLKSYRVGLSMKRTEGHAEHADVDLLKAYTCSPRILKRRLRGGDCKWTNESGQPDRADTIRGRLSAPANLEKRSHTASFRQGMPY